MSFIEEESCDPFLQDQIHLYPDQLVVDAIEVLLEYDGEFLPVYQHNKCVGRVYLSELLWFVTCHDPKYNLLFHKLNFDLESAVKVMKKSI
ncbi:MULTISPECIES: hypothetical protein [unclassified Pedobacter]|jgi:hypothetical protein|uniref:hypothetical protein n=1 Tax=unclassified Pedobacter TaxID=2628915 RepID=UPI000D47632F|nr:MULTISPECIES: hypothetical protein [unclassified Pedobacter]PTS98787.1 hypothetical protein DBR11_13935 [Pedobacter sp. HMWF019]